MVTSSNSDACTIGPTHTEKKPVLTVQIALPAPLEPTHTNFCSLRSQNQSSLFRLQQEIASRINHPHHASEIRGYVVAGLGIQEL